MGEEICVVNMSFDSLIRKWSKGESDVNPPSRSVNAKNQCDWHIELRAEKNII